MAFERYRPTTHRPDWLFALTAFGLAGFGLTMILSASAYYAGTTGGIYDFVTRQAVSLALGSVALLVLSLIDYHHWRSWAGVVFGGILVLLIAQFLSPECRGVHRCIDVGPVMFQPAEFVKLGFMIYLAAWLARLGSDIQDFRRGFMNFFLLIGCVGGIILLEPDMGTSSTLIFSAAVLYFIAGAAWRHIGVGVLVGVGLLFMMILVAPYRLERLQTFLDPQADPYGAGYQTNQISIAIGSGGLWGLGFGQGKLKYLGYVPEAHTDSIFAVVVEELGFVRASIILVVIGWLVYRAFQIARAAPDVFGRLLASGMAILIAVQAFINLAAMLGEMPLTGIPLPFVSYGGSSLVATLAAVGIILSVSRQTQVQK